MGKKTKLTTCKTCGNEIAKSAKSCPQCGAKQKKLSFIHWIGIAFFGLIIIGIINLPDDKNKEAQNGSSGVSENTAKPSAEQLKPQKEIRFIEIITKYASSFSNAKNELQESASRHQRKQEIADLIKGRGVTSWIGKINQLETNAEGKAILGIQISPDIVITTWDYEFSEGESSTFIDVDSSLFKTLSALSSGDLVKFSGSFLAADMDYIEEASITIGGSMKNPEFIFKFTSVNKIN